ncbi:MAG: class I SAM-dependent methyltransferase [Anaerolineae bacterium]
MLEIRHVDRHIGVQQAYDDIYSGQGIRHLDSFYRWILRLLRPVPGKRLLDVACGVGVLPRMAASMGIAAHGFDLSWQAMRFGAGSTARYLVANGERIPYADGIFDYVTCIGSLEHYENPAIGVREIARVLSPSGIACVLLPNTFSLLGNVLFAWHEGRTADDGQPIQRYAARYEWQDLLEANGLTVVRTVKYERELPISLADMGWYLRHPKDLVHLLLASLVPLNLANCFVFLCRPGWRTAVQGVEE